MARIPKLDAAGKFLAADVNAQIDSRAKATLRADLPALAEELEIGGGMPDGGKPGQVLTTGADGKAQWGAVSQTLTWSKDAQAKAQGYWMVVSPTAPASSTYTTADGTVVPVIWQKPIEVMVPVIPEAPYFDKYALSIQVASLVGVDYYLTGFTKDGATVDVPDVKIPDGGTLKLADVSGKPALPYTVNVEARAEPGYKLPNAFNWNYSVVDPNQVVLLTSDTFTGRDEGAALRGTMSDAKLGGTAKQWVKGWGPEGNEFRVSGGALIIGGAASRETVVLQGVGVNQRIEFDITANTLQKVNTAGYTFFTLGSVDGTNAGIHGLARLALGGHYQGTHHRRVEWGVDGKLGSKDLPAVADFVGHYVFEMFDSSLIVTVPGVAPVTVPFTRDTRYASWPSVALESNTTHQLTVDNIKVSRIGF